MTNDEAKNLLAMKGALELLDEHAEAAVIAERIHAKVERLTLMGSAGRGDVPLVQTLRSVESMIDVMRRTCAKNSACQRRPSK